MPGLCQVNNTWLEPTYYIYPCFLLTMMFTPPPRLLGRLEYVAPCRSCSVSLQLTLLMRYLTEEEVVINLRNSLHGHRAPTFKKVYKHVTTPPR